MSSHSILVVEDDPDDAFLIRRAFAKAFAEVELRFARDGEEAVDCLSRDGEQGHALPDLVLLDLKLPRMSGLEVLQWMRARPGLRRLPVVVLTSSRERRDVDAAYDMGANSYLVKPVSGDSARALGTTLGLYWLQLNVPPSPG